MTVAAPDRVVWENARQGGTPTVPEQVLANAPATMVNGRVEVHMVHHSHGTAVIESLQRSLQEAIRGQQVDTMRDMRKKRVHSSGDGSTRNSKK